MALDSSRLSSEISVKQWKEMLDPSLPRQDNSHSYIAERVDIDGTHLDLFTNKAEVKACGYTLLSLENICRLSDEILRNAPPGSLSERNQNALQVRHCVQHIIDSKSLKVNTTATKLTLVVITILKFILIGFFFLNLEKRIKAAQLDVEMANVFNQIHPKVDIDFESTVDLLRRGVVHMEPYWEDTPIYKRFLDRGEKHPRPLECFRAAVLSHDHATIQALIALQGTDLTRWEEVLAGHPFENQAIKLMVRAGMPYSRPLNLFAKAIEENDLPFIRTLIKKRYPLDGWESNFMFPLYPRDIEVIKFIFENGLRHPHPSEWLQEEDVLNCKDTGLIAALIQQGANVNGLNLERSPHLMEAIKNEQWELVDLLIAAGVNINCKNREGMTPLMLLREIEVFKKFIRLGANVNACDSDGCTVLHYFAKELKDVNLFNQFFEELQMARIDLNAQSSFKKETALMIALESDNFDIAEVLIKACADVRIQSYKNKSLLHFLLSHSGKETSQFLRIFEILKSKIDLNIQDRNGNSPLMVAFRKGHFQAAQQLIKAGANVHLRDEDKTSLLQSLIGNRLLKDEFLKLLIEAGVDLTEPNYSGRRALSTAFSERREECVALLLGPIYPYMLKLTGEKFEDLATVVNSFTQVSLDRPKLESFCQFFYEILPKEYKSDFLVFPLLFQSAEVAQACLRCMKSEEIRFGFEFLAKSYPNTCLKMLVTAIYQLNQSHLVPLECDVLGPVPDISLSTLLTMFNDLEIIPRPDDPVPLAPGVRYLDELYAESRDYLGQRVRITPDRLYEYLESLLKKIDGRIPCEGTPSASTPDLLNEYYRDLEEMLKRIAAKLAEPGLDLDRKTSALIDLALAAGKCGTRWKSEAIALTDLLCKKESDFSFNSRVMRTLQNFRLGILETLVTTQKYVSGQVMYPAMRPHIQNHYLRFIGTEMALPGADTTHDDPDYGLHGKPNSSIPKVTKEQARINFLSHYTIQAIVDHMDMAINGAKDGSGKRINLSNRSFSQDEINYWFTKNIPSEWRLDHYGSMKKILSERLDAYKAYQEPTAFKKLMAEHGDMLIETHLCALGLGSCNPNNREQLEKRMHSKKWSEKKVKESVESIRAKMDEICRVQVEATEAEVEKFVRLIFKKIVLEKEFELDISVNEALNLTAIFAAIENAREQDYLAKCVFDGEGLVKSEALSYMLETTHVFKRGSV